MNYAKHYNKLIKRARRRSLTGYCERHHVKPRCMGGDNSSKNIVKLTPEEHFVAHQLLVKIYPGNDKIVFAAWMMGNRTQTSRTYGWLRRLHAQAIGKVHRGKKLSAEHIEILRKTNLGSKRLVGFKHSEKTRAKLKGRLAWNKGQSLSPEHCVKLSDAHKGYVMPKKQRKKISATLAGKPHTESHTEKLRGQKRSPETCALISANRRKQVSPTLGKTFSAESRARMSAAQRKRFGTSVVTSDDSGSPWSMN